MIQTIKKQMIYLKTPEEIELMAAACDLTSRTLGEMAKWVKPGVATHKIDSVAKEYILDNGGRPACLGYGGFPGAVCIEVNETVVHGFPSQYTLREGDIVGLDIVAELNGYNGDMCYTFPVGEVDEKVMGLLRTTKESLAKGIDACREGNRIGDIANAIQTYVEHRGYTVVREMCGHGIGKRMRGTGPLIKNGMCIAIEPMINLGSRNIVIEQDGWTCRTRDRKPSAHFEHTVGVIGGETRVLTTFDYVKEVLGDKFI